MNATHDSNVTALDFSEKEIFLWNPHNRARLNEQPQRGFTRAQLYEFVPSLIRRNLLIAVIFLVAATVIGVQEITGMYLARFGTRTTATITSVSMRETRSGRGGTRTTYSLSYRFTANGNISISDTHSVGRDIYSRYTEGSSIQIFYDPNNPALSQPVETVANVPIAALVGLAAFIGIASITVRNYLDAAHHRMNGQIVRGEVLRCTGEKMSNNWGPYIEVNLSYRLHLPNGHTLDGNNHRNMTVADFENFECPNEGTPVAVQYWNERKYTLL